MVGGAQLEGSSSHQTSQVDASFMATSQVIALRQLAFPDHVTVLIDILEEFRKLQAGPRPSQKLLNNVNSKIYRIRHFVAWMSEGMPRLSKLKFLGQLDRLQGWVSHLRECSMALSTTLHYLKNVCQFLVFFQETPPTSSCVSNTAIVKAIRELRASIRSWARPLAIHAMHVKEKKEAALHSMEELCECRRLALLAIPKLLSKLEVQHCNMDQWKLFGYVTGFLASLYGHRLGVFLNMTDGQVTKAVHCPEKGDYLLKVEEHKTNQSFGMAKMLLSSQEYGWLLSIIQIKNRLAAGSAKSKYVFFNTNASPSTLLTRYLQMAWLEMNLRGVPTFTSLRTAVATFARDRHGEDSEERHSMARLMCHDTATSDKFYAMDLKQARKGRLLFEQAQETTSTRTLHQVPGSDLTAYRSYCVAALLIRHKLPKEAVVEFQVHDWLQRTTGTDGTTIRLTSSKAAGHTFTLSQQEDELLECYFCHVRAEATKRLTSEQGRFFVDCGGNPLTNLYADLQRLRKKYLPQVPGAAVDETPSSSETPSTSTGPASLPTPPVSLGKQWDRFLKVFPVSLRSAPPRKRQCVGAGFTAHRPLYRKWRNVQLLERSSYILSQAMGRQATQPTKEGWVNNTPSVQDVVRGWVAPRDPPTCSRRLIRSISEQRWRGLAVRDFGGEKGKGVVATCPMDKGDVVCDYHGTLISQAEGRLREDSIYRFFSQEFCIDASSRCDCHPEVDTYGRFLNHSRKRPNLKAKRFDLTFPDGPRPVLVFLAMHNIKVGEELLWDYGVTKTSFGGEGKDLAWLDM
ncbi:hypothetical protein JOQ06_000646 [Pogonophryne albipinna]|uniref:SET domain-containing protein n=1 Tax=Pogonophryne albipinna TaxID=1090488 RepID=A0AAD6AGS1_9TELE|nr:hypothetical protein JOQ06_000646 [Pogonophryne albipinna]